MFRWAFALLVAAMLVAGGLYVAAGRGAPPTLSIDRPSTAVGREGQLQVTAAAPGGRFTALTIALEQNGRTIPLFSLDAPQSAVVTQLDGDRLQIARPLGKASVAELEQGNARIVVNAE